MNAIGATPGSGGSMTTQSKWRNHFQEHKTLFMVLAVGLFLVELEIFAMAAIYSGRQSRVQVLDQQGHVIYETKGSTLDTREKSQFEHTFGPISQYRVNVETIDRPFPFRPWFAAAVGLPIGAMLLFGFFIKAYEALFFGPQSPSGSKGDSVDNAGDRLDRVLTRVGRMSIFAIGGFVLIFALGLWAIPHLLSEFGRHGVALIVRYKWVALAAAAVLLGIVLWIIYLRFCLARRAIEAQADVEKYRLQLEMMGGRSDTAQLTGPDHPPLELAHQPASDKADKKGDEQTPQ